MKFKIITFAAASILGLAAPLVFANEGHEHGKNEPKKEETQKQDPKVKPYKPDTCIVSGDKLGEMGKPLIFVHEGQEIKLCCKSCKPDFESDTAKYLKKLEVK